MHYFDGCVCVCVCVCVQMHLFAFLFASQFLESQLAPPPPPPLLPGVRCALSGMCQGCVRTADWGLWTGRPPVNGPSKRRHGRSDNPVQSTARFGGDDRAGGGCVVDRQGVCGLTLPRARAAAPSTKTRAHRTPPPTHPHDTPSPRCQAFPATRCATLSGRQTDRRAGLLGVAMAGRGTAGGPLVPIRGALGMEKGWGAAPAAACFGRSIPAPPPAPFWQTPPRTANVHVPPGSAAQQRRPYAPNRRPAALCVLMRKLSKSRISRDFTTVALLNMCTEPDGSEMMLALMETKAELAKQKETMSMTRKSHMYVRACRCVGMPWV